MKLSPREKQVTELVARGLSNPAIAKVLGIKEGTVKQHLCNIYDRHGIRNRTQLALAYAEATDGREDTL